MISPKIGLDQVDDKSTQPVAPYSEQPGLSLSNTTRRTPDTGGVVQQLSPSMRATPSDNEANIKELAPALSYTQDPQQTDLDEDYVSSPTDIAVILSNFELSLASDPCTPKEKIYLAKYFIDKVKHHLPEITNGDWKNASISKSFYLSKIKPELEQLLREHGNQKSLQAKQLCTDTKFVLDNFYEVHQATKRDLSIAFLWNSVVSSRNSTNEVVSIDDIDMMHSITLDHAIDKTKLRAKAFKEFLLSHTKECTKEGWSLQDMIEKYPEELSFLKSNTSIELVKGCINKKEDHYLALEGNGRIASLRLGFQMAIDEIGENNSSLKLPRLAVVSYIKSEGEDDSTTQAINAIIQYTQKLNTQGYSKTGIILV